MSSISISNLRKRFGESEVFADMSFTCEQGKTTIIFGPNGSGKSTLMNILAGIETADAGVINSDIRGNGLQFSYVFQKYADTLLPWRTNFANVAFPLEIQGMESDQIQARVAHIRNIFEFDFDGKGYPYNLSGGQQQMLGLVRALVTHPNTLLMDEPFSALDYENSLRFRLGLQRYRQEFEPTILMVSHNIEEVVQLADKIIVLSTRPSRVLTEVHNPLPYPRTVETLKSREFEDVLAEVLSAFQSAVNL